MDTIDTSLVLPDSPADQPAAIPFKPEQKEEFRNKLREKAKEAKWTLQKENPFDHHMILTVHQMENINNQ